MFWWSCSVLRCSKSKVHLCPCALHLYYSVASAPPLGWARQGTRALSCVSGSRTKLGLINRTKAALQILVPSTCARTLGSASASFRKSPLRYLSFCQACWCLAAQPEIVRRWKANSLAGCEVLEKGNWIRFLVRSWTGFCVLASPP